jgi:ABC-type sugar transport system substrate-binding protein
MLTLATGTGIGLALGFGFGPPVFAQSGALERAVGGYSFDEAASESPDTKNFHSNDGVLTFAIVTHTAGNGFFDPVYVGATVAANLIGAKVLLLGSESPTDDPAREIEILNQIVQDPTLDGLILTTPQVGAYDDIVKTALDKRMRDVGFDDQDRLRKLVADAHKALVDVNLELHYLSCDGVGRPTRAD